MFSATEIIWNNFTALLAADVADKYTKHKKITRLYYVLRRVGFENEEPSLVYRTKKYKSKPIAHEK